MISNIDKYIDFLVSNNLTEHQFTILWLVHTKDKKNIAKYKNKFGFNTDAVVELIESGWIDDFGLVKDDHRSYNIYDFIVTDKFTKIVVVDEDDAYEELCKVYPKWFNIKGVKVPAVTGDPRKISKSYWELGHRGNRLEHQRILEITEKYHRGKDPMVKIENYILNKMWNLIEEEISASGGKDSFTVL